MAAAEKRWRLMMRRGLFVFIALLMALSMSAVGSIRSSAQDASPAATECVAPDLPPGSPTPPEASPANGVGDDEGGPPPATAGNGTAADEATTDAVTAATQNVINCINGGDFLGVAALVTQGFQEGFLGVTNPYDVPATFEGASPMEVLSLGNVQTYEDGSVSIDFAYGGFFYAPTAVTSERWFLVQEDGLYKVDNITPHALADDVLPGATVVEVVMVDYAFHIEPKTIPAGTPVIFRITNQMEATTGHVAVLLSFPEGTTAEQIIAGDLDAEAASTGYFNSTYLEPGGTGDLAFISLDAGTYFWVCDVETESGHVHYELGMVSEITVE